MSVTLVVLAAVFIVGVAGALYWKRVRGRAAAADDSVIYLGYDDQDNVSSLRAAMLQRLERGDLDV